MQFNPAILNFSYAAKCADLTHEDRTISGLLPISQWQVCYVDGAAASKDKWQFTVSGAGTTNRAKLQLMGDDPQIASLAVAGGQVTLHVRFNWGPVAEDLVVKLVA